MPTHLGGDDEQTPSRSMEDHLAKAVHLATKHLRGKGSSFDVSTVRKTSLLRDRSARRAVKRAYRIWVSDAAHHCIQRRIDLLFTMSDNLHRDDRRDQRDTNSSSWTNIWLVRCRSALRSTVTHTPIASLKATSLKAWWSQTGSNRRPPACKAGALPAELWPRLETRRT